MSHEQSGDAEVLICDYLLSSKASEVVLILR